MSGSAKGETVRIDLGQQREVSRSVQPGSIEVHAFNVLPNVQYNYTVVRRAKPIAAFSKADLPQVRRSAEPSPCEKAEDGLRAELSGATSEAGVKRVIDGAQKRLLKADCPATDVKRVIEDMREGTTLDPIVAEISRGEEVIITMSRQQKGDEQSPPAWTVRCETEARGTWLTTYGVSIIPDRDERFWLKPTAAAGQFAVEPQEQRRNEVKFMASLFFTWLPSQDSQRDYVCGPTAGLAVSKDTYGLFLGGAVLYNSNVQLSTGASVFQTSRLNGKYHVGDTVNENLTEDQLHRRIGWPAWYAALTLRFAENPFSSAEKPEKLPSDEKEKP